MESILNLSEILDWLHSLDVTRISGHPRGVKSPLLLLFILTMNAICQRNDVPLSTVPKRNIVPMEVKERAQAAVQEVVNKTIRGDFQAALDSMNPEYLKVIARPFGGPKRLKAQYLKQMKEMGQNGVTFQAAITRRADIAFEVDYGFEDFLVDGEKVMGGRWKAQEGCTLSQVDDFRSDSQRFSVSRPIEEACETSPLSKVGI
jgi:hypothetical protein